MITQLPSKMRQHPAPRRPTRRRFRLRLLAIAVAAAMVLALPGHDATAQPAGDDNGFKVFSNSIVPLSKFGLRSEPTILSETQRQTTLQLHFSLATQNFDELEQRVARGETITPSEMMEKYSGNKTFFDTLVSWLRSQEFTITDTSPDYADVFAEGTVAQIQRSLGVQFAEVTYQGMTTPAAVTPPRLPREIGEHVIAIGGLQPFIQLKPHRLVPSAAPHAKSSSTPLLRRFAQLAAGSGTAAAPGAPPLVVADIARTYGADALGVTGEDQVIAILINTFPAMDDLRAFWAKNGLAVKDSQIQLVSLPGPNAKLPTPAGEESLDAEWASGIAPGATITIYATGSFEPSAFDRGFARIYADALRNPGLRQVSLSIGLREDDFDSGEIAAEHRLFRKLSGLGVTVFVSSGDAGSNPDHTGHGRGPDAVVEYEACDDAVVAVGGTTLERDAQGRLTVETGWSGSGGGVSKVVSRPAWQPSYGGIAGKGRLVPDVSAAAAPKALAVFNGKTVAYAGTSWSTPVWAGFAALLAQWRQHQSKPPLGFLAPLLYRLNTGFRDITAGNNGVYKAGAGWDPVTGIGVPDLKALSSALP